HVVHARGVPRDRRPLVGEARAARRPRAGAADRGAGPQGRRVFGRRAVPLPDVFDVGGVPARLEAHLYRSGEPQGEKARAIVMVVSLAGLHRPGVDARRRALERSDYRPRREHGLDARGALADRVAAVARCAGADLGTRTRATLDGAVAHRRRVADRESVERSGPRSSLPQAHALGRTRIRSQGAQGLRAVRTEKPMERKKATDFPPEVLKLFDGYIHGAISRRDFLDRAAKYAVGGFTAAAMLESLTPNYAWAQQVPKDDPRLKT